MRQLVSKLVAGGLSAAVILLWWPRVFPSEDATTWLVRGVVWTLGFELMLHALAPLETALWDTAAGRTLRSRARAAGSRIDGDSTRRALGRRTVLACTALAVPMALLVAAPPQRKTRDAVASVRQVTEIRRIVRVERRLAAVPPAARPVPVANPPIATEPVHVARPGARRRHASAPRDARTRTRTPTHSHTNHAPAPATTTERSGDSGSAVPAPQSPSQPDASRTTTARRPALA